MREPSPGTLGRVTAVLAIVLSFGASLAHADRRIERVETRRALVIGNDAYVGATPLKNALNDARAVAAALKTSGFKVELWTNTDMVTLERAIDEFVAHVGAGDVALVYYAGHAFELDGAN